MQTPINIFFVVYQNQSFSINSCVNVCYQQTVLKHNHTFTVKKRKPTFASSYIFIKQLCSNED